MRRQVDIAERKAGGTAGNRGTLTWRLLIVALGVHALVSCGESDQRSFPVRLDNTVSEAETVLDTSTSDYARFFAEQTIVGAAEIREQNLFALGTAYVVALRVDKIVVIRVQWIAVHPAATTVVVLENGESLGSFAVSQWERRNNAQAVKGARGIAATARYEWSMEADYESALGHRIFRAADAGSLSFRIMNGDAEVAVVQGGKAFDR